MNSLGRIDASQSSSESTSSDEQPEWYGREMAQEERINQTATTTYVNQQDLQEQYQQLVQDYNVVRLERDQLQTQVQAITILREEDQHTIAEQVERIEGYQEDMTAHNNVAAATRSIDWWRIAYRAGSIALNVLAFAGMIAVAVLILL